MQFDNLIVGAGLSGITLANKIATELNESVCIVDIREHIGGNVYDYYDESGICVQKYGAHIFHTNLQNVWDYLSQFTTWEPYMHKTLGYIDGMLAPIPFNINSIHKVFPESIAKKLEKKLIKQFGFNVKIPILKLRETKDDDLNFLADYIYEKVFLHYTLKQWGLSPEELDQSITGRVPVYISKDDRYFQDKYQGIPSSGYTAMVEKMLDNSLIEVCLNTDFKAVSDKYKRLFYTGAIDEFFGYKHGMLPYRAVKFDFRKYGVEYFQPNSVVNYPNNYDYTRVIEYKYFLNNNSSETIVAYEYPEAFELGKNDRYYPIIKDENQSLYNKYLDDAKKLDNVYFLGRLGDYRYYDMDKAVARALDVFNGIKK